MLKKLGCTAVLFDFDGVVGNTMEDNFQAWGAAFREMGIQISKEAYFLMEGATTLAVAEFFLNNEGGDVSLAASVVRSKERHYLARNNFVLYEDVEWLVTRLKDAAYKLGIVSGANRARLSALGINDFLAKFDVIVTGEDVNKGKPDPEPFLIAAHKLGLLPKECAVVENAPYGIASAKGAGMFCVAVCSTLNASYLVQADRVVENISKVAEIFGT